MGFNHVSANPIPNNDPDININRTSFQSNLVSPAIAVSTIIPAVSGKRISVHAASFQVGNQSNLVWDLVETSPSGATITHQLGGQFGALWNQGGFNTYPYCQWPWFTCGAGNALGMVNLGGAGTVSLSGQMIYVQA